MGASSGLNVAAAVQVSVFFHNTMRDATLKCYLP